MNLKKLLFVLVTIVFIIIGVLMWIIISNNTTNGNFDLEPIVNQLNLNNPMAEYLKNTYNCTVNTELYEDRIVLIEENVPFSEEGTTLSKEFFLEGSVLKTEISNSSSEYMNELSLVWMLVDCVGQLNGYEKGQFYEAIKGTGDSYKNYTLAKEGLEIEKNDTTTIIRIDLSKKIPIID